jgi:BirA family biotin operon repressor/biotin-[acetyl-CoA-carboxylase] ligase
MDSRRIEWHSTIDSTMRRAAELAREGAPAGTIVAAGEQTAGLGRQGRTWYSPPRGGLYFTVILRPDLPALELPVVTLALGLAVADVLQLLVGLPCDLRWPNDVLSAANGRKLCGILTQLEGKAVLAGVGLNVNQAGFPEELRGIATSMVLETGTEHDIEFLLRAVAGSIDSHVQTLKSSGTGAILRLFAASSSYVLDKRVRVALPNEEITGTTAGLTPQGFLKVRKDNGDEITVTAGGVRPA